MFSPYLCLCLCVAVIGACSPARFLHPSPLTSVDQGKLRGTWFTTRGGRRVAGFLGIPYATPPVGPLRFKVAEGPKPWTGVYSAVKEGPVCLQRSVLANLPLMPDTYGSEDCLYLNVFSPKVDSNSKFPVVVFIHGGYFEVGFGNSFLYGPEYMLDQNIILVTINYRLGILGFLSLDDPALPGNLGLKDQRAALRWVKTNIAQFGGDPQAVTLFGESAGAASVHFHMMFTAKEGLFRTGICNSGSALTPWALLRPDSQRPLVDLVVRHSACPDTPAELVDCLRQLPADHFQHFLHLAREAKGENHQRVAMVGPVLEPDIVQEPLVTSDPWNTSTALPLLLGANQMEGLFWLVDLEKDKTDKRFELFNSDYKSILPYNLHFDHSADPSEFAARLKKFYFKTENIDRKHFRQLVDLFSDRLFNYNLVESARLNRNNTFFYHMNYRGSNSVVHYLGSKNNYGVSHFDEMFHLFPIGGPLFRRETDADTIFSKQLVNMWTNFIKYLDPTPDGVPTKWMPVSSPSIEFLNIGQNGFKMDADFLKDKISFWQSLSFQGKSNIK